MRNDGLVLFFTQIFSNLPHCLQKTCFDSFPLPSKCLFRLIPITIKMLVLILVIFKIRYARRAHARTIVPAWCAEPTFSGVTYARHRPHADILQCVVTRIDYKLEFHALTHNLGPPSHVYSRAVLGLICWSGKLKCERP